MHKVCAYILSVTNAIGNGNLSLPMGMLLEGGDGGWELNTEGRGGVSLAKHVGEEKV